MRNLIAAVSVCFLLAAEDKQDAARKELEKHQGEWSMVSGEREATALPDDFVKMGKRVVKGDESTVTFGERLFMKAKITLDATKKPKTIDYTVLEGPNKGLVQLGIYELDGDTAT